MRRFSKGSDGLTGPTSHKVGSETKFMAEVTMGQNPETLRKWLRDFLIDATGYENSYYSVIDRDQSAGDLDTPLPAIEFERAEMFKSIVDTLTAICGSEEKAVHWLQHSEAFARVGGCSPLEFIEEGGFYTLHLFETLFAILRENPGDVLGLHED